MSTDENAAPTPNKSSRQGGGGQRTLLPAAGVILLIGLMAIYLVISGGADEEPAPAPPAPVAAAPAAKPADGTCPDTRNETQAPRVAPESDWELVGTIASPKDADHGPARTDAQGYRVCFSHTPVGALYAAVNFIAVGTSDLRGEGAVKRYVAESPEKQDMLASEELNDRFDEVARIQVRGYRFELVKEDRAVISLAMGVEGASKYAELVTPMRWESGDWKLVAPADGNIAGDTLANLDGYTAWSGA